MAYTCAVNKCSNGTYWLKKWKEALCDVCGCLHKDNLCLCEPPFRLIAFPTRKSNPEMRDKWKQVIGRCQGKKTWSPSKDSRVCSRHFEDGKPSDHNPLPTLDLGYEGAVQRVRRMTLFDATKPKDRKRVRKIKLEEREMLIATPIVEDPIEEFLQEPNRNEQCNKQVPSMFVLLAMIVGLIKHFVDQKMEIEKLKTEVSSLKQTIYQLKCTSHINNTLNSENYVNFYTGLPKMSTFTKLHNLIAPYVQRRWTGVVSALKTLRTYKKPTRLGPSRKLDSKTEFLMMLMKLRLGLLNKDLAKRFNISETLVSRIFFSWLRAASLVLSSMVFMPNEEALIGSKPERFRKLKQLHSIIDCTELFIETPKDLYLQSASWSDYKHHNTLKLLVACAPNSCIVFVSKAYLGRISDKALTLDCGYLDLVPPNHMIMADKGFNIGNECADRNLSLYVPPGRRGQSQMSSEMVDTTKRIANHRILIEQVIRRLKTFKILAHELPLTMVSHVDDIVTVCAALCNLKTPIYKY